MQGTIFDIKHFAVHDGPGIRQTVFFKGCPLNCWWCHNPESQVIEQESYVRINKLDGKEFKKDETIGYQITSDELFKTILGDKIFFEESDGGVTFSGGEPLMQADFLYEIALKCKENNIHICLDTTGFASEMTIQKIATVIDSFLFDIKILDNELHKKYTGVPVDSIIKNLQWLDENHKNVILRFPVIPGITNTKENLSDIKELIATLKNTHHIDILPFHTISKSKYKRFNKEYKMGDIPALSDDEMKKLKKEFETIGFTVSIGG
ncbi:MAG: glycyl-radical enzyme activating protein [Bacteroidales bacterium]|jgi:pyruvate formate lyase activating enzyme|nr:glycyl-radical enzyme activating protein [Bacteroidales bacterium]